MLHRDTKQTVCTAFPIASLWLVFLDALFDPFAHHWCCMPVHVDLSPQDGLLSDAELNFFQHACFSLELSTEELRGIKQVG